MDYMTIKEAGKNGGVTPRWIKNLREGGMKKLIAIDNNMEFKVYPFNTLKGYFSADINYYRRKARTCFCNRTCIYGDMYFVFIFTDDI